jgi:kinetochore protein NDC80
VALAEDVDKFESVVKTWSTKVSEKEDAMVNLRKEEEAKLMDAQCLAAENQDLLKKVEGQAVNVRDAERMHREMELVEHDITKLENEKATMEDKVWQLEAALVSKLEELEGIAEQCNQALKKYECGARYHILSSFVELIHLQSARINEAFIHKFLLNNLGALATILLLFYM